MTVVVTGRWPSIYTLDELKAGIREIVDAGASFETKFYLHGRHEDPLVCQGDVVALSAPVAGIDEDGAAAAFEAEYDHWIVVSNSCDHERSETIELAPLQVLDEPVGLDELETLRRYEYARRFYVPPWPGSPDRAHRVADFTRMVVLEKAALTKGAAVIAARLDFPGWAVLHACLVMYFARDDGRAD